MPREDERRELIEALRMVDGEPMALTDVLGLPKYTVDRRIDHHGLRPEAARIRERVRRRFRLPPWGNPCS